MIFPHSNRIGMKQYLVGIFSAVITFSSAQAGCIGNSSFSTCSDASGNTYTNNRIGNTTYTSGYNSSIGSSWNQSTNRIGNTSYTNGTSADGGSWNKSSQQIGSYTYHNGSDSNGNSFNYSCNQYGCN